MGIERTTPLGGASGSPEPDNTEDLERIASYLDGAAPAFREIDDWIRREIVARYPVLRGEVEDVSQAVHAKLVRNLRGGRFLGRSSLRTYVAGMAHHTSVDRIRSLYRDRAVFSQEAAPHEPASPENPYRSLRELEEGRLFYEALRRSPEACRELWRLVFLEKLSYDAIAEKLAIPAGTVKSRMWYCRKKVSDLLARMRGGGKTP